MVAIRAALDGLTAAGTASTGKKVYLYGEGWNFGEVANNALLQAGHAGQPRRHRASGRSATGCGTRSAAAARSTTTRECRASARARSPTRTARRSTARPAAAGARPHDADLVRLGMAGNLREYSLHGRAGARSRGDEIDYNGQPAGYADSPEEVITYVDAHDNETLFDALTYKLPPAPRWPTGCG